MGSRRLGDYAYSVVSVRQSTITKEPQVVQAFVDAAVQALGIVAKDRGAVEAMTRKEFPTLPANGVKATLDRAYADHLWSVDGMVSEQGYNLDMEVVNKIGGLYQAGPLRRRRRHAICPQGSAEELASWA